MFITSVAYIQALKQLKDDYDNLHWIQRFWFWLWSRSLCSALISINFQEPTIEQVDALLKASDEARFFKTIFGLLLKFRESIEKLSFSRLPKEILLIIKQKLSLKDNLSLSSTSKSFPFFDSRLIEPFLWRVVHGEYYAVETMLENNIDLILHKGNVTDYSGRAFYHISGFEYALWSLDKHMWMSMLYCLPKNEKGKKVKADLLKQYREFKEKVVAYELEGNLIKEQHFDFENTIIKQLKIQTQNGGKDWDTTIQQWCKGVGGAQRLLPIHVVYEYCSEEPFYPTPAFIEQPHLGSFFSILKRSPLSTRFFCGVSKKYEYWFRSSRLGVDFAIYRGTYKDAQAEGEVSKEDRYEVMVVLQDSANQDLLAIQTLYRVRMADFEALEQLLMQTPEPDKPLVINSSYG